MNQGARDANDEIRHYSERQREESMIMLLREIRDLLAWRFRDDPREEPHAVAAVDPQASDPGTPSQREKGARSSQAAPGSPIPPSDHGEVPE